jgi:hypothetical protein
VPDNTDSKERSINTRHTDSDHSTRTTGSTDSAAGRGDSPDNHPATPFNTTAFRKTMVAHWEKSADHPIARWRAETLPSQPHTATDTGVTTVAAPTAAAAVTPAVTPAVAATAAVVPAVEVPRPKTESSTQAYAEILQEVRVAQTALQFLLGFLMAISVTPRFAVFTTTDRVIYVSALVLALASFTLLTAPAPFHRLVTDPRRKHRLVSISSRLALWGLALLMLALTCSVLLVLSVVMHITTAAYLSGAILVWLLGFWFCLPLRARLRDRRTP